MQIEPFRRTLRGQARSILRDQLLSGRLRPGQKVNEAQMAAEIGISRGTLREAIRALEQEALLVSIPHRGTFVRRFTPREAEDLQEVRLSLELTAACRVARAWSPAVKRFIDDRLEALRVAYETPLPFPARVAADLALHEAICESSGNEALLNLWRSLIGNITVMVLNVGQERMTDLQHPGGHREMVDAIASGDEARIRRVYNKAFEEGTRAVTAAVAARAADTDKVARR